MVTHFIATAPRTHGWKKIWKIMMEKWDIHDWIIGMEKGKGGYEHLQIRGSLSGDFERFFKWHTDTGTGYHIEKSNTAPYETPYERKEGKFWGSEDTNEVRRIRFGNPNNVQRNILKTLQNQSNREVDVWLDPRGNHGKSWLAIHLWETGRALVIPRASTTPDKLSAFICSAWRGEEIIIIDIPRAQKMDPRIYETIEEVKDGLVFDHRYSGKTRNVRGTKLLVFTNTPLDTKKLSKDRWRLHGINEEEGARGGAPIVILRRSPPLGGESRLKGCYGGARGQATAMHRLPASDRYSFAGTTDYSDCSVVVAQGTTSTGSFQISLRSEMPEKFQTLIVPPRVVSRAVLSEELELMVVASGVNVLKLNIVLEP